MQELDRRKLFGLAAMTPLVAALTRKGTAGMTLSGPAAAARERIRERYFPDFTLLTQDNHKKRFYTDLVKDKIVIINFFYAHCEGICPRVTSNLVQVQRLLADRMDRDVFMLSLTLKPAEDSPAVLKDYARMHGIGRGWSLLTGNPDNLEHLRWSLGFTNLDPQLDQDKSQHIGNIRYGSEPLMQWTALPGMTKADSIAKAIRRDFPKGQG